MDKTIDAEFAARFPTIHNCNFWTRHRDGDVLGGDVWDAIVAVFERGCDDEDLLDSLAALEETLAEHAESDSEESVTACQRAEEAVQAEWQGCSGTQDQRTGRWMRGAS